MRMSPRVCKLRQPAALFTLVFGMFALLCPGFAQQVVESPDAWRWRPSGIAAEPQEQSKKAIIDARGRYFDNLIGCDEPLDEYHPDAGCRGIFRDRAVVPELPVDESSTIVRATFESYKVHLSPSRKSIYTELIFRPSEVFMSCPALKSSDNFSLLKGGGTALINGTPLRFSLHDDLDLLTPGKEYVLFLIYSQETSSYEPVKSWILDSGTIIPNSWDEARRIEQGQFQHANADRAQLLGELRAKVDARLREGGFCK